MACIWWILSTPTTGRIFVKTCSRIINFIHSVNQSFNQSKLVSDTKYRTQSKNSLTVIRNVSFHETRTFRNRTHYLWVNLRKEIYYYSLFQNWTWYFHKWKYFLICLISVHNIISLSTSWTIIFKNIKFFMTCIFMFNI